MVHDKISTFRIVGSIFFNNTVNSQVNVMELLQPFIAQLTEEEREYAFSRKMALRRIRHGFQCHKSMKLSEKDVQFPQVYGLLDCPICLPAIFICGLT